MERKTKIRFIAVVNLHKDIILFLRRNEYNVDWIYDIDLKMSDSEILNLCYAENKILMTNDKDFGDLIFNKKHKCTGLILFRGDEERKALYTTKFDCTLITLIKADYLWNCLSSNNIRILCFS